MSQRLRITYRVDGPLRYASHLEQMHAWERAARRAGIPLAYSGGYNPRPKMQIAAALPVGFGAEGELLDVWLEEEVIPAAARAALNETLPHGLAAAEIHPVALDEPALQTRILSAGYRAVVETEEPIPAVRQRIADLLAASTLPRERRGRPYDLRPLIEELHIIEDASPLTLFMRLAAREGATGRPEEVLDALDLAGSFYRITRLFLNLEDLPTPNSTPEEASHEP